MQIIDWGHVRERAVQYYYLTRLHRPIGILLLLWPTGWALWVAAAGWPDWPVLLVFLLGVVLMRSAGCVINDFADRNFDPRIRRTRDRPIASGKVTPKEALWLFAALCLLAFLLVLSMNRLTIYLAFVAVALAAVYPFMKRYTHLPQVVLGMTFGWSIPMAFAAQTGEVPRIAWLLYVINVLWSVIYDTMYAMVDREDDLRAGVKSTAVLFAEADRVIIGILQVFMLLGLVLLGRQLALSTVYYLGVAVAAGLSLYQQYLIRGREPNACFRAFLNNNWLGFAVFAGFFLSYR
ncbi:MAG TPA: 4-hydroxybenzoate octaprenyltransferase [Gammaproteobacteria bacterium]|nr:4-hydroxybenzoate octaprenyltransferase [Gammaproteobacteria bacterium]